MDEIFSISVMQIYLGLVKFLSSKDFQLYTVWLLWSIEHVYTINIIDESITIPVEFWLIFHLLIPTNRMLMWRMWVTHVIYLSEDYNTGKIHVHEPVIVADEDGWSV